MLILNFQGQKTVWRSLFAFYCGLFSCTPICIKVCKGFAPWVTIFSPSVQHTCKMIGYLHVICSMLPYEGIWWAVYEPGRICYVPSWRTAFNEFKWKYWAFYWAIFLLLVMKCLLPVYCASLLFCCPAVNSIEFASWDLLLKNEKYLVFIIRRTPHTLLCISTQGYMIHEFNWPLLQRYNW